MNVIIEIDQTGGFSHWFQSVDWKGVGNASLGLCIGTVETIAGVGGEIFTAGLSTALAIDGSVRVASNGVKLFYLLKGNSEIGNSTPSNIGGWIGKGIDWSNGVSYNQIGVGQGVGSFSNDFLTFIASGGTALSMSGALTYPSFGTVSQYGLILVGTPYSAYSDAKSAGF